MTHQKKIIHSVRKEIEQPKTIIKPLDNMPLQPVMVGMVDIVENNYHPCKYTKITATYTKDAEKTYAGKDKNPKEPVIIFDESQTTEAKKINFVGGTKKIDVELADYKTDKCKIKKCTKGSHTEHIAYLDNNELSISDEGKTSFELGYKYNELLPKENLNPLKNIKNQIDIIKYIWPMKNGLIQHHNLKFATCRHSKTIPINVYPDVKWELSFSLDFSSTEASMGKNLSGATKEKANKANKEFKEEKQYNLKHGQTQATFGLMLGATYDDEQQKQEVGIEYEKKIRDFLGILLMAKDVADKVLDTAKDSKSQLPFSIKIDFPKLNASFSWCIVNRTATTVGVKGEFDFNADPLVGASFTLDLFKLGSRAIPIVAFVYDLINSQAKGKYVEYEGKLKLDLIFSGEIKLNLANISFETNPFEISAEKINLDGEFGVVLRFSIGLSLKVKAFETEAKTNIEGNASFDAYFAGTATLDIDEYGLFIAPEVKFSGMKAKLVFVAEFAFKSKWIKDNEVKANHETTFEAIIFDESPPLKLPRFPVI